jgi:Ca2+-binding RTX toxin-like protein
LLIQSDGGRKQNSMGTLEDTIASRPPALPSGYKVVFYDDFNIRAPQNGTEYDHGANRGVWQSLYGGDSLYWNGAFRWDHRGVNFDEGGSTTASTGGSNEARISANYNASWDPDWIAGGISTARSWDVNNPLAWDHGRFEFRAKVDPGKGVGPAVLLWPNHDGWPPEIDLLESPDPNRQGMYFSIHWKEGPNNEHRSVSYHFADVDASQWHTYRLDWQGNNMSFFVDGIKKNDHLGNDPGVKMAFGMQMYVAHEGDQWYGGAPDDAAKASGADADGISLHVDWVRVSQPAGTATPPPPTGPTTGNDSLTGTANADTIDLLAGDDTYNGMGKNDVIKGNTGKDTLTGGSGKDRFDYDLTTHSPAGTGRDVITDFDAGSGSTVVDRIDLYHIDASTSVSGNQNFSFIGTNSFSDSGQVRINNAASSSYTLVELNIGGTTAPEMQIQLNKIISSYFSSADFIL